MLHDIDLRRLSARHGPERAFVSLHLSGPDGLASLARREERIRALLEDAPEELVHFDAGLRLVRDLLRVGLAFCVRPLAELQEERSGFVVVVASTARTRVLTVPAEEIKSEYLAGGLAVVGPEDVLQASQVGRVEILVVTRDAKLSGSECRGCENVFAGELQRCRACGSGSVFPVDLVDALARQVELTSAEIDFVDPLPGLTKVGGVAALLRY